MHSPEEREENERTTIGGVWARWDGLAFHINPGGIFRVVELISSAQVRMRSLGAAVDGSGYGRAHVEMYARRGVLKKLRDGGPWDSKLRAPGSSARCG